ncbi:hypothetical protein AQ490_18260 [Wenjunlia vitaminophila]|uniref:Peptidase MA superfamily protein n=1 Tax=Wenjunlia vitaminophila TaxID=76728 RepID=A0A0T6LVM2_WENVI|nr:hypothetical protein [Wenjunlia vitaminophila]KRV49890.1 hypothetical protein AQ490_18260 [Wenjunlia vitaminophila]
MPGAAETRRRHPARTLLALGVLVALAAAAWLALPVGPRGARSGEPDRDRAAVAEVLRHRADAVLDRDRQAYLRQIDLERKAFRAAEDRRFTNLREVPLASFGYRLLDTEPAGDGRTRATAELRYRLRGHDDRPVTGAEEFLLTERAGRLRISADRGGTAQLWDFGPVRAVRGEHGLVLGLGDRGTLAARAAEADRAVSAVRQVWHDGWDGTVVLLVPGTSRQMTALLGVPEGTYRDIAAVTTAELRHGSAAPADRVVVNPDAFDRLSAFGRQAVLTHETTHVATRRGTGPATPLWLSEGFADWVAYRDSGRSPREIAPELRRDVLAGRAPGRLPADADFAPDAAGLAQSYQTAWLACRLIAEEYGQDRLVELYRTPGDTDARTRRVLGTGYDDFLRRWRDYLERELR